MIRRLILVAGLCAALFAGGPFAMPDEALAQGGCLSPQQARQAVQRGQAVPLGQLIGAVRQQVGGGKVLPPPQLCNMGGGRFVYVVNLLRGGGQVTRVTVDALSGAILGY